MSRLEGRVKRLWSATHTYLKGSDWPILVAYYRSPIDDAKMNIEDFDEICVEIGKRMSTVDADDSPTVTSILNEYIERDPKNYWAYMYKNTLKLSESYPKGLWIPNNSTAFFERLEAARRQWAEKKRKGITVW